jgi:hypothetical protein
LAAFPVDFIYTQTLGRLEVKSPLKDRCDDETPLAHSDDREGAHPDNSAHSKREFNGELPDCESAMAATLFIATMQVSSA